MPVSVFEFFYAYNLFEEVWKARQIFFGWNIVNYNLGGGNTLSFRHRNQAVEAFGGWGRGERVGAETAHAAQWDPPIPRSRGGSVVLVV